MRPSRCAYGTAAWSTAEDVRLIVAGIDTIHLSASKRTPLPPEILDAADKATASHVEQPFEWTDEWGCLWTLLVQPGGGRAANWVLLKGRDFDLKLCRPESKKCSTIEIRAEALWSSGALEVASDIASAASVLLGRGREGAGFWKVSRADLCVDVHAEFRQEDRERWRKLARFDADHVGLGQETGPVEVGAETAWRTGQTFTGWIFGKGDPLMGRIYLKSLQAPKHSPWIFELWSRCPNYNATRPVWRVEFECKRGALKAWRVDTLAQLKAQQTAIWRYLTWEWLTLRATRKHDKDKAISAAWRWISEGAFDPLFLRQTPMASRTARDALDLRQTLAQARGLLTNAVAVLVKTGRLAPGAVAQVAGDADLFPAWMREAIEGAVADGALEGRDQAEQQAALRRASAKRLSSAAERQRRRPEEGPLPAVRDR